MAFINKDGLQHLTNKLVRAENIKIASLRGSTIKEVIDNIQRECDNIANPNTMVIENKVSVFKAGEGNNANVSGDIEEGISSLTFKGKTYQNVVTGIQLMNGGSSFKDGIFTIPEEAKCFEGIRFNSITKPNTLYTVILDVIETFKRKPTETGATYKVQINDGAAQYNKDLKIGRNIFTIQTISTINSIHVGIYSLERGHGQMIFKTPIVLEGDYTQTPIEELPEYFEGIKSSFEDSTINIEIKSPNLADITTDNRLESAKGNFSIANIEPGEYTLSLKRNNESIKYNLLLRVNGEYKNIEGAGGLSTSICSFTIKEKGILRMNAYTNNIDIWDIMLVKGKFNQLSMPSFVPYNIRTKSIDIQEPLKSLPNGTYDEIKNNNGQWQLIRRIGKVVFNGSESEKWSIHTSDWVLQNSIVFSITFPNSKGYLWTTYSGKESICDKIPSLRDDTCRTTDMLAYTNDNFGAAKRFRIPKSYLSTQDITGFKQWLSDNPITIYYELANENITSLNEHDLSCIISQGDTINLNSNIAPISTHTVTLNRSGQIEQSIELIAKLRNKIDNLEREYDNNLLNTQLQINNLKLNLKLKGDK